MALAKKAAKETKEAEPVADVKKVGEGFCVECGKPNAPGQTYVCPDHIRSA